MPALLSTGARMGPWTEAMIAATSEKAIMFTPHLLTTVLSIIHDGRRVHCGFSDCAVAIDQAAIITVPSTQRLGTRTDATEIARREPGKSPGSGTPPRGPLHCRARP